MTATRLRPLLRADGIFVLGDVLRPGAGMVNEVGSLLRFGAREGFLVAALTGLARTALSGYRELRNRLGLTRYNEADITALLQSAGFSVRRAAKNIGHNQKRMTFILTARAAARGNLTER